MLNRKSIAIVRGDFEKLAPLAPMAADLFYEHLFTLDPGLRSLFTPNLAEQKTKLLQMLGTAVQGLDDLPALVPVLQALGRRHAAYGVKSENYGTVGVALLWTLKQGLGAAFGRANEAAWTEVYGLLADTMRHAS